MAAKNQVEAQPILNQRGKETQAFDTLTRYPLGLGDEARMTSVSCTSCSTSMPRNRRKP